MCKIVQKQNCIIDTTNVRHISTGISLESVVDHNYSNHILRKNYKIRFGIIYL